MSTNPEEYHGSGEDESPETGTAYNPTTGEPETTPHDIELAEEDAEAGNPNAASSAGLEGDMGISSERTGPSDETGTAGLGDLDQFDMRSVGTAKGRTHGSTPTAAPGANESKAAEVHGPEMDDTQARATRAWREGQPAAGDDDEPVPQPAPGDDAGSRSAVAERNTADVPGHRLSNKNPGHSGGGTPPTS